MGGKRLTDDSDLLTRHRKLIGAIFGVKLEKVDDDALMGIVINKMFRDTFNKADQARYMKAIKYRYGLLGKRPLTYKEIGQELDVSITRAQQLVRRGFRMLRHPIRSKRLRIFILDDIGRKLKGECT